MAVLSPHPILDMGLPQMIDCASLMTPELGIAPDHHLPFLLTLLDLDQLGIIK